MTSPSFHHHVWADGKRVVLCQEHATPGRLALFRNADGHNPNNPPVDPEQCEYATCYTTEYGCWVTQTLDRWRVWHTRCTPVPPPVPLAYCYFCHGPLTGERHVCPADEAELAALPF